MKKALFIAFILLAFIGCSEKETVEPSVTSISIAESSVNIKLGDTHTLKVSHSPANLKAPAYTWESSNNDVVTVKGGQLTALSVGDVTITVKAKELGLSATCKVTVAAKALTISLSENEKKLIVGDEFILHATVHNGNPYQSTLIK